MGTDYIFATGRVRSMEKKLLTGEQLRTMTESKNVDDIFKVLQDAGYGAEGNAIKADNYEDVLRQAETELFAEIKDLSKEAELFRIFAYPMDYHNMKVLLKAESLGINRDEILMENGTIPSSEMAKIINQRNRTLLTENMVKALNEAIDTHARTKDPQVIDFICDKYCYKEICDCAAQSGNQFVQGYVALWMDTINLKTFVRVRKMGQPSSYYSKVFLPGGNVELHIFLQAYEDDMKQVPERFRRYDIREAAERGIESMEKTGTFTLLEKLCDDTLMKYLREAKSITFGVEPMMAFLVAKQMEIKCIRILLAGKLADMDPSVIRERMRETYE